MPGACGSTGSARLRQDRGHALLIESSGGLRARPQRAENRLLKSRYVQFGLLVVFGSIFVASSGLLLFSNEPSLREWALTALPSTLGAFFGWMLGRFRR